MMKLIKITLLCTMLALLSCGSGSISGETGSADKARIDSLFTFTEQKALEVMQTGFNAGGVYKEVWIRDYNTFIELSAELYEPEVLKENLLVFFGMQGVNCTSPGKPMD